MHDFHRLLRHLALALAVFVPSFAAAQNAPIPFEELGKTFTAAHVPKGTPPEGAGFDGVLKRDYVSVHVGAFELHYPVAFLDDKQHTEAFRDVTAGVCDLQSHWADWLVMAPDKAKAAHADFVAYRAWIEAWKLPSLLNIAKEPDKDVFTLFKADAATLDLQKRLHTLMFSAADIGLVPQKSGDVRIVFAPTRLDFMQALGFSGLVDAEAKQTNWVDGASDWTQFWIGQTLVIALEYAPWTGTDPTFKSGQPMSKIGPTVMVQHVVQQSTIALFWYCEPTTVLGHFESAVSLDMAIAVCGEVNTIENAGSVYNTGGKTQPYSRFVPGGNPRGGTLPARKANSLNMVAENQWRKGLGKDHFLAPLAAGQKAGAKDAKGPTQKDSLANFLLKGDDGGAKFVVHAPFFGPNAIDQEYPPAQFLIDYAEFYRSYKTAFVWWLQTKADPKSAEESKKKFDALLVAMPKHGEKETWEDVVTKVYGVPISGKDKSTDSLEWRFLKWIANGK